MSFVYGNRVLRDNMMAIGKIFIVLFLLSTRIRANLNKRGHVSYNRDDMAPLD